MNTLDFVQWRTPYPLWSAALADDDLVRFSAPALLRFSGEAFVPALLAALAGPDADIRLLVAGPESRGRPAVGWQPDGKRGVRDLCLYQPAHGRFYLAAASMVSAIPGQPDAAPPAASTASLVLRRLQPGAAREWAWTGGPPACWRPAPAGALLTGEERCPTYSVPSADGRRLFRFALIPAQNREAYTGATLHPAGSAAEDPRLAGLAAAVLRPLAALAEVRSEQMAGALSTVLLLELAAFLHIHLPQRWSDIPFYPRWSEALRTVWAARQRVLRGDGETPSFNLARVVRSADLDRLRDAVAARLGTEDLPAAAREDDEPLYVVRFALEALGGHQTGMVLGPPSAAFRLAAVDDPRAPRRPGAPPEHQPGKVLRALWHALAPTLPRHGPGAAAGAAAGVPAPRLRVRGPRRRLARGRPGAAGSRPDAARTAVRGHGAPRSASEAGGNA